MNREPEPTGPDLDDALMRRARTRILRAIATARARDRYNRTHCHITLAQAGPGVAHNPACAPWPVTGARWTEDALLALPLRPGETRIEPLPLLWRTTDPNEVPIIMSGWARKVPELAAAIDAGIELRRAAGLPTDRIAHKTPHWLQDMPPRIGPPRTEGPTP